MLGDHKTWGKTAKVSLSKFKVITYWLWHRIRVRVCICEIFFSSCFILNKCAFLIQGYWCRCQYLMNVIVKIYNLHLWTNKKKTKCMAVCVCFVCGIALTLNSSWIIPNSIECDLTFLSQSPYVKRHIPFFLN